MRLTTVFVPVALVSLFLTSGCGTVRNLCDDQPQPYGGVAKDAEFFLAVPGGLCPNGGDGKGLVAILALCGAEVCASAVADTLVLPWLYYRSRRAAEPVEPATATEDLPPQYSAGATAAPR